MSDHTSRTDLAELHEELRAVARSALAGDPGSAVSSPRLATLGWLGLEVPEALGGAGATFAELAVVLEELGRAAATSPVLGSVVLGVGALLAAEPSPARDDLLRGIAGGKRAVAVALTESGDDALVEASFGLDESPARGLVLHGRATFVPDAGEADQLLVVAHDLDGRPVLVVVDPAAVTISARPAVDETHRFAEVAAAGIPVESASVLPFAAADGVAQRLLDRQAVALACDGLGLAEAMLDATVAYVSERHQFGRPVGSFQAVKHALADLVVELALGRQLVAAAIEAIAAPHGDAGLAASRAKALATELAVAVAGEAMQLHGALGYSWESGIHVHLKRAILDRSLGGSPAAHRRRIAAALAGSAVSAGPPG